jgi:hypothetical protein
VDVVAPLVFAAFAAPRVLIVLEVVVAGAVLFLVTFAAIVVLDVTIDVNAALVLVAFSVVVFVVVVVVAVDAAALFLVAFAVLLVFVVVLDVNVDTALALVDFVVVADVGLIVDIFAVAVTFPTFTFVAI